jgi:hypothetical protein
MKMSSAVDGYSGKIQVGVGRTGAAPELAQTSEAKQIKTGPSAHNSGRERRAKGDLFFYVYSVVPWTSTGNSPRRVGNNSLLCHPACPAVPRRAVGRAVGAKPEEGLPKRRVQRQRCARRAWLLGWTSGGSVRLKRLMRHKGRIGLCFLPVFWFWSAEGLQTEMVCWNLSARGPFPKWGYADHWRLIHDFDRESVTWLAAIQQAGIFVFHLISPVTNGTISSSSAAGRRRSRLSFGDRVIWTRASDRSSGVSQVVKTAQSRGRTERTLLVR